ncbi:hypothetical protein [Okeania sp. SIO2B9]|uniref:hypothetical protein n=1 Tax=Okeania sp. SIO2B9 TaxID=2607782 RepID=UPI00142BAB57|nr:hypothetical protein [Okeania sp. SIO2B9]NES92060.1 hypothetical protein [Okeania sp. SIO2B9]
MIDKSLESHFIKTPEGHPAGGKTTGIGVNISWQNGNITKNEDGEPVLNGATVETVIQCAITRLDFFQDSNFANEYNARTITSLQDAIAHLEARTADRKTRGVEGTYEP